MKKLVKNKMELSGPTSTVNVVNLPQYNSGLFSSMFSHYISNAYCTVCTDEVDKYLGQHCEAPQMDPIGFWKVHAKQFPHLSLAAQDILSIPGSSVTIERIFNCGRDV